MPHKKRKFTKNSVKFSVYFHKILGKGFKLFLLCKFKSVFTNFVATNKLPNFQYQKLGEQKKPWSLKCGQNFLNFLINGKILTMFLL